MIASVQQHLGKYERASGAYRLGEQRVGEVEGLCEGTRCGEQRSIAVVRERVECGNRVPDKKAGQLPAAPPVARALIERSRPLFY